MPRRKNLGGGGHAGAFAYQSKPSVMLTQTVIVITGSATVARGRICVQSGRYSTLMALEWSAAMSAVTFDTLAFVKTLEAAGIPVAQAEAISSAVRQAQSGADLATKGDIARLEARLDTLDAKFDMLKWMLALILAAVLLPLVKSFF